MVKRFSSLTIAKGCRSAIDGKSRRKRDCIEFEDGFSDYGLDRVF